MNTASLTKLFKLIVDNSEEKVSSSYSKETGHVLKIDGEQIGRSIEEYHDLCQSDLTMALGLISAELIEPLREQGFVESHLAAVEFIKPIVYQILSGKQ